jgi:hypothetical protein
VILPKDVEGYYPKAMSVADGYIFVGGSRDRGKLYAFNSSTLSSAGFIAAPTDVGEGGWLDIPYAIQAFKKSTGQYIILVEENSKGKNIVYQWCPTGACSGTVTAASTSTAPPVISSIYPNPVSGGKLNVSLSSKTKGSASITLTNALGARVVKSVVSVVTGENTFQVSAVGLRPGIYMLAFEQNGTRVVKKICIE